MILVVVIPGTDTVHVFAVPFSSYQYPYPAIRDDERERDKREIGWKMQEKCEERERGGEER